VPGIADGDAPIASRPASNSRFRPRIFRPEKSAGETSGFFAEVKMPSLVSTIHAMFFTPRAAIFASSSFEASEPMKAFCLATEVIR